MRVVLDRALFMIMICSVFFTRLTCACTRASSLDHACANVGYIMNRTTFVPVPEKQMSTALQLARPGNHTDMAHRRPSNLAPHHATSSQGPCQGDLALATRGVMQHCGPCLGWCVAGYQTWGLYVGYASATQAAKRRKQSVVRAMNQMTVVLAGSARPGAEGLKS